jgi:outer membrane protein assembly factor BamA
LLLQSSWPHAGDDWVVVAGARVEHHRLGAGHVPDWPSTDQVYPGLYADAQDQQSAWLTAALRYDTRDSQSNPYGGWLVEAGVDAEPWSRDESQPGSEHGEIWHLTSSYAIAVPGLLHSGGDAQEENPPTDVLAIGGFVTWVDGPLPFWDLPSLGGVNTLRGYIGGRFTDRAAWHVAGEYRLWVIPRGMRLTDSIRVERFGVAPFVEIGSVADSLTHLETSAKHESYGLSFRAELERTAIFRFDVGWSAEGVAFNLAYGLSF